MTEEENKAIEKFKLWVDGKTYLGIGNKEAKALLNLIEKLKKENEELKEKIFKRDKELIKLEEYANKNFERKDDVKAKYIPKDKISELIKEPTIITSDGDYISVKKVKKLLEEE